MKERIGIIQVRGIGDAVIALPIAEYYHYKGYEVFFALDDRFCESFQEAAPYCTFVPVPFSAFNKDWGINNEYWYELPLSLLKQKGCQHIFSFPYHESHLLASNKDPRVKQSLEHRLQGEFERRVTNFQLFKHLKFDEFKYATARVPFEQKWKLNIARNYDREEKLYESVVPKDKKYIVTHLMGSDIQYNPNSFNIDREKFEIVNITPDKTDNIFDWLTTIERADSVICLDSIYCNLIEQLNIAIPKHFIRRSSIFMTPVLKNGWDYVEVKIEQ